MGLSSVSAQVAILAECLAGPRTWPTCLPDVVCPTLNTDARSWNTAGPVDPKKIFIHIHLEYNEAVKFYLPV
jgi:hypothetical protein